LYLYADTISRLGDELDQCATVPKAIYISPSTDPFPPIRAVQNASVRVVETLAQRGIDAWLMTRGYIRPFAMRRLAACREHVRVTVAMTSTDRELQRALEPLAAPPSLRLKQIRKLIHFGVRTQVAVEPLIPGLTDTPSNLRNLFESLAEAGIRRITAGYLFLRPVIKANLEATLKSHGIDAGLLDAYSEGPLLKGDALAAARYLPKRERQRRYAAVMSLAAQHGITACVSGVTNPDFDAVRRAGSSAVPRLVDRNDRL
jgi:DNA repair photolyase